LPEESDFVAAAREAIPSAKVTTAQTRGGLSGRGRGKASSAGAGRGTGRGNARKIYHNKLDQALLQQHQSLQEEEGKELKGNHKKMEQPQLQQRLQEEETEATVIARTWNGISFVVW
jgi:hypothetical protein